MEGKKILVVDDFSTMRRITKKMLAALDITEVDEAADGPEAFKAIAENDYDLVLSDCYMPEMTGIELTAKVREAGTKDLPIILVTSEEKSEVLQEAYQAGVNDFIIKPFNLDILKEKLTKAWR